MLAAFIPLLLCTQIDCVYLGKGFCGVRKIVFEEEVSAYSQRLKVTDGGQVCR